MMNNKKRNEGLKSGLTGSLKDMTRGLGELGNLYIEKTRLQLVQKLSVLLSAVAFVGVVVVLATLFVVFITIGIGHLLATSVAPHLAYLIVSCFYLVVLVVAICLRKRWFTNPVTRFVSRLLCDDSKINEDELGETENDVYNESQNDGDVESDHESENEESERDASDTKKKSLTTIARQIADLIEEENKKYNAEENLSEDTETEGGEES